MLPHQRTIDLGAEAPIARRGSRPGGVVRVVGVAGGAEQRGEVEIGQLPGAVVDEIAIGERRAGLLVREVGQSARVVEQVVGLGHQLGAGQIGVAGKLLRPAEVVEQEVDRLLGHGIAAGLALLLDRGDAAEGVEGGVGEEVGGVVEGGGGLGAAAGGVVLGRKDDGRLKPGDLLGDGDRPAEVVERVGVVGRGVAGGAGRPGAGWCFRTRVPFILERKLPPPVAARDPAAS